MRILVLLALLVPFIANASFISGKQSAGGVSIVGTFLGSSVTNGASISSSTIYFGPADATNPGMVGISTDHWAGAKGFAGAVVCEVASPATGNPGTPCLQGQDNATGNSTAAPVWVLRGANKTAGTGNGGDLLLYTGLTTGGVSGKIKMYTQAAGLAATPVQAFEIGYQSGDTVTKTGNLFQIGISGSGGIDYGITNNGFTYNFNGGLFWATDGGSSGSAFIGNRTAKRPSRIFALNEIGVAGLLTVTGDQYVTSTSNFTVSADTTSVIINPAGVTAAQTVTMPAAPNNGNVVVISCGADGVTALTIAANSGQTLVGGAAAACIASSKRFKYLTAQTTWFPF